MVLSIKSGSAISLRSGPDRYLVSVPRPIAGCCHLAGEFNGVIPDPLTNYSENFTTMALINRLPIILLTN